MLPSPASADITRATGLTLNIPDPMQSPDIPLKKLENMMLNHLIPLESPPAIVSIIH